MGRNLRDCPPGGIHHVGNRGLGQRPCFEVEEDFLMFRGLLFRHAHLMEVEIHAFSLLFNHFHLLLEDLKGRLSEFMHVVLASYVRWFNERRRRDGPLFRSRYWSRLIVDDRDAATVLRYIDYNPVAAQLCKSPGDWRHGSAAHYLGRTRNRGVSDSLVRRLLTLWLRDPAVRLSTVYGRVFGHSPSTDERDHVERGMRGLDRADLAGLPMPLLSVMDERARNADGVPVLVAVVGPKSVARLLCEPETAELAPHLSQRKSTVVTPERRFLAVLLRVVCSLSLSECADRTGLSTSAIHRLARRHQSLIRDHSAYCSAFVRLMGKTCLARFSR